VLGYFDSLFFKQEDCRPLSDFDPALPSLPFSHGKLVAPQATGKGSPQRNPAETDFLEAESSSGMVTPASTTKQRSKSLLIAFDLRIRSESGVGFMIRRACRTRTKADES